MLILQYISNKQDSFKEGLKFIKKAGNKKVCYVTLNKSCDAIKDALKKKKINSKNIFFIDAISAVINTPKKVPGCTFAKAPYDLAGIKSKIKTAIKGGYTLVIFDSLSSLLAYGQRIPAGKHTLTKFIKSFEKDLGKNKGETIFIVKSVDKENFLIEETLSSFDKIRGGSK